METHTPTGEPPFDAAGPTGGLGVLHHLVRRAEACAGRSSELAGMLCQALVAATRLDGAALVLSYDPSMVVPVAASGPEAFEAERIEFTLGHGPCHQALRRDVPVLLRDLRELGTHDLLDLDAQYARAVLSQTPWQLVAATPFALTIDVRAALIGYCRDSIPLSQLPSAPVHEAAISLVVEALRRSLQDGPAPWQDAGPTLQRGQVWVAEEAVALAGGTGRETALARLRALAFAMGRPVEDIATDIIAGHLAVADVLS